MSKLRLFSLALIVIALGAICANFIFGYGSHRLIRPSGTTSTKVSQEFEWGNASPSYSESYVRPAVANYISGLPPGASVLDLGCGNGSLIASFRARGWKLTGADISSSGIEQARSHWTGIRFEKVDATGDVDVLGLGQYDAIISTEVIEHVFLPNAFAKNCRRLLKPGGILVLSTPYHGYLKNLAIAISGGFDRHWDPLFDYGHIKFWSVSTLSQLLWDAGFENLEWRGAGRVPPFWKSMVIKAQRGS